MRDYHERGGDLLQLPTAKSLIMTREKMIPPGMEATVTEAKVTMQNTVDHTASRIVERPDVEDLLEDGAVLQLLWKAGCDGQTGLGKISRSKNHDDDQSLNTGMAVIQMTDEMGSVILKNSKCGGVDLYQPLSKINKKETDEVIVETVQNLIDEVRNALSSKNIISVPFTLFIQAPLEG